MYSLYAFVSSGPVCWYVRDTEAIITKEREFDDEITVFCDECNQLASSVDSVKYTKITNQKRIIYIPNYYNMIVLAFDRDWTVDVNPHPNREAVPLEYVRYWSEETPHEVWATGNQLLVDEAAIPGTVETVRRLKGDLSLFGEYDETTGRYANWPERATRLKMLEELFPEADQYIVVDDLDLSSVDNWDHYYAWDFMEALRSGEINLETPETDTSNMITSSDPTATLTHNTKVSLWDGLTQTPPEYARLHPLQSDQGLVATHRLHSDKRSPTTQPGPISKELSLEAERIRNKWIQTATADDPDGPSTFDRDVHNTEAVTRLDWAVGIMVGLACGDALGRPVEFKSPQRIERDYGVVRDFHADGSHGQPAGTLTDDTVQALYLICVVLEANGFDKQLYADRLVEWYENDPFDVGMTTLNSIKYLQGDVSPDEAGEKTLTYRGKERAAGNGSVMRCAPLAIAYPDDWDELQRVSRESSHVTHADSRCAHGAAVLNLTLAAIINGSVDPLSDALAALSDEAPAELVERLQRIPDGIDASELKNTGYVVDTLETALYIGLTADDPEEAIITAVNMGGDADTIGAVVGAIVGARFGAGSRLEPLDEDHNQPFPDRWVDSLTPDIVSFEDQIIPALLELGQISTLGYSADQTVATEALSIARDIH